MPANILNLPDFKVRRVEESDHDYHVYAEVSNPPGVCTSCGSDRLIGHGRNEQVIRDLPTHGKRLAIYVDTRCWRCQSCGKTFMEDPLAVNAKREMTDRALVMPRASETRSSGNGSPVIRAARSPRGGRARSLPRAQSGDGGLWRVLWRQYRRGRVPSLPRPSVA